MNKSFPDRPIPAAPIRAALILAAVVAALGGFLLGFDTVVISGANDALKDLFGLDRNQQGSTVAVLMLGTMVGALVAGKPAEVFGRKNALFALAIVYFVSALGCALARTWPQLLAARALEGLAIGGASVISPMYIAEISPPHLRGRLVAISQVNLVIGILVCAVSNYLIAQWFAPDVAWRWMLGVAALPSAAFFFLIFAIPESPRWLVKAARSAEARQALERLGHRDVAGELAAIQASLADRPDHAQNRLFQRALAPSIGLAVAMAVFNQLTGINAILYYAPAIFEVAGSSAKEALLQTIYVAGSLFVFTVVAMFIIDSFGRRVLMRVGSLGMVGCLSVVAWEFSQSAEQRHGPLLVVALLGHIAFFACSQGSVIWVFISEIFPNAVRAKGQTLAWFVHWTMAAAVAWKFPLVRDDHPAWAFGFFAAMMALQFCFALWIMPETKGGALEDIGKRLAARRP